MPVTIPVELVAGLLAAALACGAADPPPIRTLVRPQPVRLELPDGRRVAGTIERFDAEWLEGPIGRFRWSELAPVEAWRVRRLLAPPRDAAGWLELAAFMRSLEGGEELATRAIREARRLGASDGAVAAALAEGDIAAERRRRLAAERAAAALRTGSPEALVAPGPAWTEPDDEARAAATRELRAAMAVRLAATGRELVAVETDEWLAYADAGPETAAILAVRLDRVVPVAAGVLGRPDAWRPFAGKGVVAVLADAEAFRLLEASAFRQAAGPDDRGFVHYDGPHALVTVRADGLDARGIEEVATRGAARAILHRLGSPIRLPPWANEGVADLVATAALGTRGGGAPRSDPLERRLEGRLRAAGHALVRAEPPVLAAFAIERYDDPQAAPRRAEIEALGFLLASRLRERDPRRLAAWIGLVKEGEPWREAFRRSFGFEFEAAVADLVAWHRTND